MTLLSKRTGQREAPVLHRDMEKTRRMVEIAFREWHIRRFGALPPDQYKEIQEERAEEEI